MSQAVQLQGVTKNYGLLPALRSIDLEVSLGESVAFLGPNGAGKSTLLKIVAGQISPSSGLVRVMGCDVQKNPEEVKSLVGLVGHRSFMYDELTVDENLEFYGGFFDASSEDYERVIEMTALGRWRDVKAGHLSYGLRKRSDIARALLSQPKVLVLDELFSGIDQDTAESLVKHLKARRGQTLLVSSHSLERVTELCGRGVYLRAGIVEKEVELI